MLRHRRFADSLIAGALIALVVVPVLAAADPWPPCPRDRSPSTAAPESRAASPTPTPSRRRVREPTA